MELTLDIDHEAERISEALGFTEDEAKEVLKRARALINEDTSLKKTEAAEKLWKSLEERELILILSVTLLSKPKQAEQYQNLMGSVAKLLNLASNALTKEIGTEKEGLRIKKNGKS